MIKFKYSQLYNFSKELLIAAGAWEKDAEIVADVLTWTEFTERRAQGVSFRLPLMVERVNKKVINSPSNSKFLKKSEVIWVLDGNNGFGQVNAVKAILKAIKIAEKLGVGIVFVKNSNHYGAGAYYCKIAIDKKMIVLVTSNSFPRVAPYGGKSAVLGTNPISFGCPTNKEYPILIDMATSSLAQSTIKEYKKRKEKLPEHSALNKNGDETIVPQEALEGCILPSGGAKGYSLAIIVEVLSGVLSGAGISHSVGSIWNDFKQGVNAGHFFMVLNPNLIMEEKTFFDRINFLINEIEKIKPREKFEKVRIPGSKRYQLLSNNLMHGVFLDNDTILKLNKLAHEFKIQPLG